MSPLNCIRLSAVSLGTGSKDNFPRNWKLDGHFPEIPGKYDLIYREKYKGQNYDISLPNCSGNPKDD
jgi:hypothetical protein